MSATVPPATAPTVTPAEARREDVPRREPRGAAAADPRGARRRRRHPPPARRPEGRRRRLLPEALRRGRRARRHASASTPTRAPPRTRTSAPRSTRTRRPTSPRSSRPSSRPPRRSASRARGRRAVPRRRWAPPLTGAGRCAPLPARHRLHRRRAAGQARRPGGRRGPRGAGHPRALRGRRAVRRAAADGRRALPRPPAPSPPPSRRPPRRPRRRCPSPVAAAEVEPAAPARPVQADTQELALVEGGLSPALAADVVAETVSHLLPFGTPRQLKRLVRQALARRIPVQGPRALGGAAVVLAGAGGSGKTLTVARLAAAYARAATSTSS